MIEKKWRKKKDKWKILYGGKVLQFLQRRNLKKGVMSKPLIVDFIFSFSLYFIFIFIFIFILFSIFRTTQVRVYLSCCHISHKLMAKSQD